MPTRVADHDWLSSPSDSPANTRWEGLISPEGISTLAQINLWCWDGSAAQAGAAQVRLLDAAGALDADALADLRGQAVEVRQADTDGTLAASVPVARYVVDRIIVDSDGSKTLNLRDAHDDLDVTINAGIFADTVKGLAGRTQPISIGAVFNSPVLLTGSDGSVGWLADAPQAVAVLRDRGDAMEAGTWALDSFQQQVKLTSPPLGPMTANISSVSVVAGDPTPATLDQALREIMRRANITAWSTSDAQAIDTASGYTGIGFYADQPVTARQLLAAFCNTYGCWYWQDASGVLRLARIADPAAGTSVFSLDGSDLLEDVTFTTDTAPGLTTRMAWRPNACVLRETDLVTDFADVPHELRAILTSKQTGIVTAAGAATLPSEYAHAVKAEPVQSLFWLAANAQSEIDRIIGMYQVVRRNWIVRINSQSLAPLPGQVCTLTYPRYGLAAGKKLLVRRVERNPATGDINLTLWG